MKTIGSIIKEFSDSFNIITTGFRQIDTRKRGWHPGELCIIGGRPRMGKTAFILSVIKNILKEDFPIALFTATDTIHIQFLSRIVSHLTNKNLTISTAKNLKLLQETGFILILYYTTKRAISQDDPFCIKQLILFFQFANSALCNIAPLLFQFDS